MPWALLSSSCWISAAFQLERASGGVSSVVQPRWPARRGHRRLQRRAHRPRDSAARAGSRRWARAPRRCWRRPCGWPILAASIVCHPVGRGPHALADLGAAGEAGGQADLDVALLIGRQPGLGLDRVLAHHRAGFHGGVDLVAGAVEEAGVDEHDAVARGVDAGREVGAGAALLVHDADLDGVARAGRARPRPGRTGRSAKATSSGPCIFGFTT